jgi:hypothetical protein
MPDTDPVAPRLPGNAFVCLPICSFKNQYVSPYTHGHQLHGIVLQVVDSSSQSYERVGYFWTAVDTVVDKMMKSLRTDGESPSSTRSISIH